MDRNLEPEKTLSILQSFIKQSPEITPKIISHGNFKIFFIISFILSVFLSVSYQLPNLFWTFGVVRNDFFREEN